MIFYSPAKLVRELRKLRAGHYNRRKYSATDIAKGIGVVRRETVQRWLGPTNSRGGKIYHAPSASNVERIRQFLLVLKIHPALPQQSGDPEQDVQEQGADALAFEDDSE